VELEVAGDVNTGRLESERAKSPGALLVLGANRCEIAGRPREHTREALVSAERSLGEPRVREHDRDAVSRGSAEEIRPEIVLDHDDEGGREPSKGAIDGAGEVEREANHGPI